MARVQTTHEHRHDNLAPCLKFSGESPGDKPTLFAMVCNEFSSFLSKYWVMLHGRLPFSF